MAQRRWLRREALDEWFATIARYVGVLFGAYGVIFDRGKNPYLFPFATFLVGLKSVVKYVKSRDEGER